MHEPIRVQKSSGHVCADLDPPEPEEALATAELACQIGEIIGKRGLSQVEAATWLGLDQPKISALIRGREAAKDANANAGYPGEDQLHHQGGTTGDRGRERRALSMSNGDGARPSIWRCRADTREPGIASDSGETLMETVRIAHPTQVGVSDRVTFSDGHRTCAGYVARKGRTYAHVVTDDSKEFRVPYAMLSRVVGVPQKHVEGRTDTVRAQFHPGVRVRFVVGTEVLHGAISRLNPA